MSGFGVYRSVAHDMMEEHNFRLEAARQERIRDRGLSATRHKAKPSSKAKRKIKQASRRKNRKK